MLILSEPASLKACLSGSQLDLHGGVGFLSHTRFGVTGLLPYGNGRCDLNLDESLTREAPVSCLFFVVVFFDSRHSS